MDASLETFREKSFSLRTKKRKKKERKKRKCGLQLCGWL